jgi:hypothetical protein
VLLMSGNKRDLVREVGRRLCRNAETVIDSQELMTALVRTSLATRNTLDLLWLNVALDGFKAAEPMKLPMNLGQLGCAEMKKRDARWRRSAET